jgi:hypothetical protein
MNWKPLFNPLFPGVKLMRWQTADGQLKDCYAQVFVDETTETDGYSSATMSGFKTGIAVLSRDVETITPTTQVTISNICYRLTNPMNDGDGVIFFTAQEV